MKNHLATAILLGAFGGFLPQSFANEKPSAGVQESEVRANDVDEDGLTLYERKSFDFTRVALKHASKCSVIAIRAPNAFVWAWLTSDKAKVLKSESFGYVWNQKQIERYDELLKDYPDIQIQRTTQLLAREPHDGEKRSFDNVRTDEEVRRLARKGIDAVKNSCD